jgi:NADPH2:quinone reductase
MRAWTVREFGPFRQVLRLEERPLPGLVRGSVRVRVRAADINFPDLLMIAGLYQVRPELPFTPGFAAVGEVVEVVEGGEPGGLAAGDRVVCPLPFGGFQESVCIPVQDAFPIPQAMSDAEAAAFFVSFQTAWFALVHRARLTAGERLLVHAGASGVGTAAIQMGKVLGATVLATAGGREKVELCRRLGADHVFDHLAGDFAAGVREATGGHGADVVFDPVGGDPFDRSLRCIAWEGRLLVIGFASGRIPTVPANRVLLKNIGVLGMYWGGYWERTPERVREAHGELVELYRQGRIAPAIDREVPFEKLPEALAAVERREVRGKAVLALS